MARLTRGYPFAFQVLGHFTFEHGGDYKAAIPLCKQYLEEYVYDKIWSELSHTDKRVLSGVLAVKNGNVSDIREYLDMTPNSFGTYRNRLIKKGLLYGEEFGHVSLALPFFEDYVMTHES